MQNNRRTQHLKNHFLCCISSPFSLIYCLRHRLLVCSWSSSQLQAKIAFSFYDSAKDVFVFDRPSCALIAHTTKRRNATCMEPWYAECTPPPNCHWKSVKDNHNRSSIQPSSTFQMNVWVCKPSELLEIGKPTRNHILSFLVRKPAQPAV